MDTARYEKNQDLLEEIREVSEDPDTAPDPAKTKKLRVLTYVLCVLPFLNFAVWRYLDVPYRPFAALQVILALIPTLLGIVLPWLIWQVRVGPAWVAMLLAAVASFAMGMLAWALGRLLTRAVQYKEENDLTV